MLGARLHVEQDEDVAAAAIATARALGSTYVLMGTPASRRGLGRLLGRGDARSLLGRLLDELPGVDVRVIADPALRESSRDPDAPAPERAR
jgi:K+-sensing histidine kinase KdpD